MAVQSIISIGQGSVFESNAVFAFDDDTFGSGGDKAGVFHGDVGGGINGRRAFAGSLVGALVDSDCAAAAIGTDGGARGAGGGDGEVGGIHDAATGGHDTAGVVFGGFDGGVGNVDSGAVGIAIIGGGGTAVAENAVGASGVGSDFGVLDVQSGACTREDGGVGAVEAGVVATITVTGFGDSDVCQVGSNAAGGEDDVLVGVGGSELAGGDSFVCGDFFGGGIGRGGSAGAH